MSEQINQSSHLSPDQIDRAWVAVQAANQAFDNITRCRRLQLALSDIVAASLESVRVWPEAVSSLESQLSKAQENFSAHLAVADQYISKEFNPFNNQNIEQAPNKLVSSQSNWLLLNQEQAEKAQKFQVALADKLNSLGKNPENIRLLSVDQAGQLSFYLVDCSEPLTRGDHKDQNAISWTYNYLMSRLGQDLVISVDNQNYDLCSSMSLEVFIALVEDIRINSPKDLVNFKSATILTAEKQTSNYVLVSYIDSENRTKLFSAAKDQPRLFQHYRAGLRLAVQIK